MPKKPYIPPKLKKHLDLGDYYDKLEPDQKEFIERFDCDMNAGGVYMPGTVLESESSKREARRRLNASRRDAFEVTQQNGALEFIDVNAEEYRDFMNAASDEWSWQDEYDRFGYEKAAEMITNQSVADLDNPSIDKRIVLSQYHIKMNKLHRLRRKEQAKLKE